MTGQAGRTLLQLLAIVVLARLLTPRDYGLLTVVTVIVGFGEIFRDFGLSTAAVRSPDISRGQTINLFWVNTLLGCVLATAMVIGAAPLAAALDQPELHRIAQVMAVVFLLNGATAQFRATLMRELRFRWLAITDVGAATLALAVAVVLAVNGWGYWTLVAQQVTQATLVLLAVAVGAGWLPGLPQRNASISSFLRFGSNLAFSQVVNYAANNLENTIISAQHGPMALGLYNRAHRLIVAPLSQVQGPLTSVAVPILSRVRQDADQFSRYISQGQLALGYPIGIGLGLVCGLAEPIVALLLGAQWMETVPIVRLLALAGIARTLSFVGFWIYVTQGLSRSLFRYTLVSSAIRILCVAVGAQWGVIGVAVGVVLASFIEWPLSIYWLSRLTPTPRRALYLGALRVLVATVAAAGPAAAIGYSTLTSDLLAPLVVVLGMLAATSCVAALISIPVFRRDARALLQILRLTIVRQQPK